MASLEPDHCGITTRSGVPAIIGERDLPSVSVPGCTAPGWQIRGGAPSTITRSSRLRISAALTLRIGALLCCIGARRNSAAAAAASDTVAALATPLPGGAVGVSSRGGGGRTTAAPNPPSWRVAGEGGRRVPRRWSRSSWEAASSTATSLEYQSDTGPALSGSAQAVASYLEALSSGSIAAPTEGAVSSYLGALSAGKIGAPPTADAIASYLGSVAAAPARPSETSEAAATRRSPVSASSAASPGKPVGLRHRDGEAPAPDDPILASRSHLDLITEACRGDQDAEGEDCKRAVVSYAHAVTVRGAPPSLMGADKHDEDEEAVAAVAEEAVAGVEGGGGGVTSADSAPSEPRTSYEFSTAAAAAGDSPASPEAAIVEGCYGRVASVADLGRTLYDVLELSRDATPKDIKNQYVALARLSHPDAVASASKGQAASEPKEVVGDAGLAASAATSNHQVSTGSPPDFAEVAAAYRVLSDARLRMRYDRSLWARSFTRDVGRAADEVGRVAGPRVVDLFRRLVRGAADALRGHDGGGAGATGATGLDPQ